MEVRFGQPNTYGATLGEVRGLGGGLNNGIPNVNLYGTDEPTSDIGVDGQIYIQDVEFQEDPVVWVKMNNIWSKASSFIAIGTDEPDSTIQATMYAQLEDLSSGAKPIWECKALYVIKDGEWVKFYDHELRDYINSVSDTLNLESERIDYVEEDVGDLKQRASMTETTVVNLGKGLVQVNNEVSELKQDISSLEQTDTQILTSIVNINRDIDNLDTELTNVSKAQQIDRDMIKSIVGDWYTEDKVTSYANEVSVPSNAYPYAELQMVGGMSRKGYQLLDYSLFKASSSKVSFSINGNTISVTTSTSYTTANVDIEPSLIQGKTISLQHSSLTISDGATSGYSVRFWVKETESSPTVYHVKSEGAVTMPNKIHSARFEIVPINQATSLSEPRTLTITDLMVVEGANPKPFEPYTPNLIDAKVDEVVSVGKNLLNVSNVFDNCYINASQSNLQNIDGANTYWAKVKKNTNYIITRDKGDRTLIFGTNEKPTRTATNLIQIINFATANLSQTFNSGDCEYILFYGNRYAETKANWIQIEKGNTATAYSPYKEVTKPIPQAIIDLCPNYGIGVNQNCYNFIDFVEKKYHKRVASLRVGDTDWAKIGGTTSGFDTPNITNAKQSSLNLISARYVATATGEDKTMATSGTGKIRVFDFGFTDAETFRTQRADDLIYYKLATEEVIDLTDVWVDDLDILNVEGNGTVKFSYENDDVYAVDVPSTILYQEKA